MSSRSNPATIKDLLHEVTDAVEPGDRLDAIRAATADSGRRTHRGWWAVGGVGLVAASVVTAVALSTGGAPRSVRPDAAAPAPTTAREDVVREDRKPVAAVYYVGDTAVGPRLYREFRPVVVDADANPLDAAVRAAVGRYGDGSPLPPLDPDYRVPWPAGTDASARVVPSQDLIEISLGGDPEGSLRDRGSLSSAEASLAVEQVVRTAQGVVGERLPVRLLLYGKPADQILGVPAAEELTATPDLDVLAHVNISDPFEGQIVDNDAPFVLTGVGTGFEGNIVTNVERQDGTEVVAPVSTIASGEGPPRLWPYDVTFDLADLSPGVYVVTSQTEDPSGAGNAYEDSRTIKVVD